MRQRRARKTTIRLYESTDPRRHGPGRGSINFSRWFANLTEAEQKSTVQAEVERLFKYNRIPRMADFNRDPLPGVTAMLAIPEEERRLKSINE